MNGMESARALFSCRCQSARVIENVCPGCSPRSLTLSLTLIFKAEPVAFLGFFTRLIKLKTDYEFNKMLGNNPIILSTTQKCRLVGVQASKSRVFFFNSPMMLCHP